MLESPKLQACFMAYPHDMGRVILRNASDINFGIILCHNLPHSKL